MKIGLVYGHVASNLGDLAINEGISSWIAETWPDSQLHVVFVDPHPAYASSARHSFRMAPGLTFSFLEANRLDEGRGKTSDSQSIASLCEHALSTDTFLQQAQLDECDLILYNSGEHFFFARGAGNPLDLLWRAFPLYAALRAGQRVAVLPQTFGPFESGPISQLIRCIVQEVDAVAARDAASKRAINALIKRSRNIPALLDPAFMLPSSSNPAWDCLGGSNVGKDIGLVMRLESFGLRAGRSASAKASHALKNDGFEQSSSWQLSQAVLRRVLADTEARAKIFIQSAADKRLAEAILAGLPDDLARERCALIRPRSVLEYRQELSQLRAVVASRFHACVLAWAQGVPAIGLQFPQHGPKMGGLFELLGVSSLCVDLSKHTSEDAAARVAATLKEIDQHLPSVKRQIEALRRRTNKWFRSLHDTPATRPTDSHELGKLFWTAVAVHASKHGVYLEGERIRYAEAAGRIKKLSVDLAESNSLVDRLKAETTRLRQEASSARDAQESSAENVRALQEQLSKYVHQLARVHEERGELRARLDAGQKRMDELVSEASSLESLTIELREELATIRAQLEAEKHASLILSKSVEEARAESALLSKRNYALNKELDEQNYQCRQLMQEKADLERSLQEARGRAEELISTIESLRRDLAKEIETLRRKHARMAQEWNAARRALYDEREALRKRLVTSQRLWRTRGRVIRSLERELRAARRATLEIENAASYRLGREFVSATRSWRTALRLPATLLRLYRQWKSAHPRPDASDSMPTVDLTTLAHTCVSEGIDALLLRPEIADVDDQIAARRLIELARHLLSVGRADAARQVARRAVAIYPERHVRQWYRRFSKPRKGDRKQGRSRVAATIDLAEESASAPVESGSIPEPDNDRDRVRRAREILRECSLAASAGELERALDLAREASRLAEIRSAKFALARAYFHLTRYDEAIASINRIGPDEALRQPEARLKVRCQLYSALCRDAERTSTSMEPVSPVPGRVVCILHSCLPFLSGGYATRAHGLISALKEKGCDIRPYVRPGFPYDVKDGLTPGSAGATSDVGSIEYRLLEPGITRRLGEADYMYAAAGIFERIFREERPEIVHGRSTYLISLPALIAARRCGIPFVYEVSGLWEIVLESRPNANEKRAEALRMRRLETVVAKHADRVLTLTQAMKDELVSRGVHPDKISLAPNCVDPQKFRPSPVDHELRQHLRIPTDAVVIGYIGSFVDYEGLDDLVGACERLAHTSRNFRLLLVGDGPAHRAIVESVRMSTIGDLVIMPGRISHDEVARYYSIIDICPFPRKSWPVCEIVSPMKPLEALAMSKAVVVSSVHALAEMIEHGNTGMVYEKGSQAALAEALMLLLAEPERRKALGDSGRDWTTKHRTWAQVSSRLLEAYEQARTSRSATFPTTLDAKQAVR